MLDPEENPLEGIFTQAMQEGEQAHIRRELQRILIPGVLFLCLLLAGALWLFSDVFSELFRAMFGWL